MNPVNRKPYKRTDRLSQQIKEELSILIRRRVQNPKLGMITITDVNIRSDFKTAAVKYCRMMEDASEPTNEQIKETKKALKSAEAFLFENLKRQMPVKYLPWLEWKYDDSLAKAAKVWHLMNQLDAKKQSAPQEDQHAIG